MASQSMAIPGRPRSGRIARIGFLVGIGACTGAYIVANAWSDPTFVKRYAMYYSDSESEHKRNLENFYGIRIISKDEPAIRYLAERLPRMARFHPALRMHIKDAKIIVYPEGPDAGSFEGGRGYLGIHTMPYAPDLFEELFIHEAAHRWIKNMGNEDQTELKRLWNKLHPRKDAEENIAYACADVYRVLATDGRETRSLDDKSLRILAQYGLISASEQQKFMRLARQSIIEITQISK
jgi:hypothetical protein